MNTITDIYRHNLRVLSMEAGGPGKLAARIGKSASQVSQWLNASTDSKTAKPRNLSWQTAREIEDRFPKSKGWMDTLQPLPRAHCRDTAATVHAAISTLPSSTMAADYIKRATKACAKAMRVVDEDAARDLLQAVRADVHQARNYGINPDLEPETAASLLAIHRDLYACLGGTTLEDSDGARLTPVQLFVHFLESVHRMCEEYEDGDEVGKLVGYDRESETGAFWQAFFANDRGHEEGVLAQLPALHARYMRALQLLDDFDVRKPLIAASLAHVRHFMAADDAQRHAGASRAGAALATA